MIQIKPFLNFESALGMRLEAILGEKNFKFDAYALCERDAGLLLPFRPNPGDRIVIIENAFLVEGRLNGFIDLAGVVKEVSFVRRADSVQAVVEMALENEDMLTSDTHRLKIHELLVADGWS